MFWIVGSIFLLILIAGVSLFKHFSNDPTVKRPALITQIVLSVIFILLFASSCFDTVKNGNIGLIYQFGAITGQRDNPGIVIHAPWQSVELQNTKVQSILPPSVCSDDAKTAHCLDAASSETQDVFVVATINIHIDKKNIQTLFKTIGPDYVNILVDPRVAQVTKEEISKYKAVDVIPNREKLRQIIAQRLTQELSVDSITVDDFLLTDVHFSTQFNKAIEDSQKAAQDAKAEQNKVAIHEAQAAQAVADAKGVADSQVIAAKGTHDSNELINSSLTPGLIQWETIGKLAPDVKVIMMPSNNGIIMNMGDLTGSSTTATP